MKSSENRTGRRRWWLGALWVGAAGFGGIGAMGARGYIQRTLDRERGALAERSRTRSMVVAKADLPAGATISTESMAVRQYPVAFVPPSAVPVAEFDAVVGQRTLVPMAAGEPLLAGSIQPPARGFSTRVGHGIRALTVVVDEVNSVSGMLRPGDRIDLMFSARAERERGRHGGEFTVPIMQDLEILATGRRTEDHDDPAGRRGFRTITVEVTPEQAKKLVLAQRGGRLTALLRNPGDRNPIDTRSVDMRSLLGLPPHEDRPAPEPAPQLIVGGRGPIAMPRVDDGG